VILYTAIVHQPIMTRFVSGRAAGKTSYSLNAHGFAVLLKLLLLFSILLPSELSRSFAQMYKV
jgi:hypothetical protein